MTFEQRSEGSEGMNHVYVWGEQCSRYSKEQQESYCGWNEVTPVGGEERTNRK